MTMSQNMSSELSPVVRDDYTKDKNGASGYFNIGGFYNPLYQQTALPPTLYGVSDRTDIILRSTIRAESLWASAVKTAISKVITRSWKVTASRSPRLVNDAHQILLNADYGAGWSQFMKRNLRDYFCVDKGMFFGVQRVRNHYSAKVTGFFHLDALRCTLTGNIDYPVIYRDSLGNEHNLRWYDVVHISDMTDSSVEGRGTGICAAHTAYHRIVVQSTIETYLREKVSGGRPQSVFFINNVARSVLQEGMQEAAEQSMAEGYTAFGRTVVIPLLNEAPPHVAEIALAALPDGFDIDKERAYSALVYADALGLDPQDIKPVGGQQIGAGAQSAILDDKSSGRNIEALIQELTHRINRLFPEQVWFGFSENDYRDQKQAAEIESDHILNAKKSVESGMLTAAQALNWLVDKGIYPPEFLALDQTSAITYFDTDKPSAMQDRIADASEIADEATVAAVASALVLAPEPVAVPVPVPMSPAQMPPQPVSRSQAIRAQRDAEQNRGSNVQNVSGKRPRNYGNSEGEPSSEPQEESREKAWGDELDESRTNAGVFVKESHVRITESVLKKARRHYRSLLDKK